MSKTVKTILIIGMIVLGTLLLLGAGAWYWWNQNSAELIAAGRASMTEGRAAGSNLEESGCVNQALMQHKADWNRSLSSSIRNGLWLTGCLETSKPQEKFCLDVPSHSDIVSAGAWSGFACSQNGLSDPYCPTLLQNVSKYCASPARDRKLRMGKPPDAALNTDLSWVARHAG